MPTRESRPENNPGAATQPAKADAHSTDATDRFRHDKTSLRAEVLIAWQRRPWLSCGCSDSCRCEYKLSPSDKRTTAYREAVEWLAEHKLDAAPLMPEARQLWRRGGSDRAVADRVIRRWTA